MVKKKKNLANSIKKNFDLSKIKTPSLDLLKNTKDKINNYYKNLKKERENQKKKDAKRKILEEKKELKLQKKLEQKEHLNKIREEKKQRGRMATKT